jgi:hypothetical protein
VIDLAEIETDVRNAITTIKDKAEEVISTHLPKLAQAAEDAQADPLITAIESVFLPDDIKAMIATLVTKLGQAKPVAPAEPDPATAEATAAAADTPPMPMPEPAGPQATGVA